MRASIQTFSCVAIAAALVAVAGSSTTNAAPPKTNYWEGEQLVGIRANSEAQPDGVRLALKQLRTAADDALPRGPYSVMDKQIVPPSGDKHDYMSYSRYWWPNPDTPDGLPYIRRDGEVNRKLLSNGDRNRIGAFYDDFEALALAAYLIDADAYGPRATELLRVWFLDPSTRMNPNLKYGQAVPGRSEGRSPGVIDTRHFIRVMDAAVLLRSIDAISEEEFGATQTWFGEFLDWLLTSEIGIGEREAKNNHGAWFAAQASMIALFTGQPDLAVTLANEVRDNRIAHQIEPDGSQPEELQRTRSLHYSCFSLSAFAVTARAGEHVGVDLWGYEAPDGASLRRAIDFVVPYVADPDSWPHQSLERFAFSDRQSQLFYLAASRLETPRYLTVLAESPERYRGRHLTPLLFSVSPAK